MGCCGSGTPLWGGSAPSPRPAPPAPVGQPMRYSHAFFEYVGATAMTVTGGATGKTYRFAENDQKVVAAYLGVEDEEVEKVEAEVGL